MDLRVRVAGRLLRLLPGSTITSMTPDRLRRAQEQGIGHNRLTDLVFGPVAAGVSPADRTVAGPDGDLPLRVYTPTARERSGAVVLHVHGGGWALGSLDQGDWLCSQVSAATGAVVVSVEYRLAPTHRFPAAVEDCWAALVWVAEHADELGADAARLGVMGDSAGGNLAAVLCLLARERSGPAIRHQALLYPATDLTLAGESLTTNADRPVLTTADVVAFRDHYLGGDPARARDPHASPLLAEDLHGLPPALVQVAEHDPIRDDGTRYAERLRAAGVPVRLTEYVGMPHGYLSFPRLCRSARQALAEIAAEQVAALAPAEHATPRG